MCLRSTLRDPAFEALLLELILGAICYQIATKTWQVGSGLNRGGSAPSPSHLLISRNLDQRPHLPPDSSYLPAVETLEELWDVGAFVVLPPAPYWTGRVLSKGRDVSTHQLSRRHSMSNAPMRTIWERTMPPLVSVERSSLGPGNVGQREVNGLGLRGLEEQWRFPPSRLWTRNTLRLVLAAVLALAATV